MKVNVILSFSLSYFSVLSEYLSLIFIFDVLSLVKDILFPPLINLYTVTA